MDSTGSKQPNNEGWTLVTRRRRPPHFSPSPLSPPRQARTLSPHSLTYAQILQKPSPSPTNATPTHHPNQSTTPNSIAIQNQTIVCSPQSPTALPYPPNPYLKEWWGRCLRCARKGHVIAECTYPRLTPSYVKDSQLTHTGPHSAPRSTASPSAPAPPNLPPRRLTTPEPGFDDLLTGSEPHFQPDMPLNRPNKAICYFNRDLQYQHTLQKLTKGIIVQPPQHLKGKLSLDQVAQTMATSTKVLASQLQIATFSQDRFLVLLPSTIDRDLVVTAIPRHIWDEGYRFHSYSPWWDASVSIPTFKIWIDIHGVPLELCTDSHMARAVSSFGTFLGSIEPQTHGDCQTYCIFLATDDLSLIPHEIDFRVGGLVHTASIHPKKWLKNAVYHRVDLPAMWFSYPPPPLLIPPSISPPTPAQQTPPVDPIWFQGDDVVPMSLSALREVFKDFNSSDLPRDPGGLPSGDKTVSVVY